MTITFVIPTYNAEKYLKTCLKSIRNQTAKSEIIIVDGGSTDNTLSIASSFGAKILENTARIAEFGLKLGILATNTDLVVVFAADNELTVKTWVEYVIGCFRRRPISALWSGIVGDSNPINQYIELIQSDPLCWFLNPPHVWGANGLVYRTKDIKSIFDVEGYVGDNDAFQTMVEQGKNFYYGFCPAIHHYANSLGECFWKWFRNHSQHYIGRKRNMNWAGKHWKIKSLLWVFYAIFLSFPHSVWLAIRDKNIHWLYHFPMNITQLGAYGYAKCRSAYLQIRR